MVHNAPLHSRAHAQISTGVFGSSLCKPLSRKSSSTQAIWSPYRTGSPGQGADRCKEQAVIVHCPGLGELDLVRRVLSTLDTKLQGCPYSSHPPKPLKLVLGLVDNSEPISAGEKNTASLWDPSCMSRTRASWERWRSWQGLNAAGCTKKLTQLI